MCTFAAQAAGYYLRSISFVQLSRKLKYSHTHAYFEVKCIQKRLCIFVDIIIYLCGTCFICACLKFLIH